MAVGIQIASGSSTISSYYQVEAFSVTKSGRLSIVSGGTVIVNTNARPNIISSGGQVYVINGGHLSKTEVNIGGQLHIGNNFDATWSLVGCGDFSGDGKDQVVMSHNAADYYAIGIDGAWTNLGASDSGWEVRAIGDFSGDGRDDIVAFHKETGLVAMWGDGNAANWSKLGQLDAEDWFVIGAGDYNADAKDDLLVRQKSTGMLGYYASGDMAQWVEMGRGVDMNWTVIA